METEARWSEMRRDGPNSSLSTDKAARRIVGRHDYFIDRLETMESVETKNFTRQNSMLER